MARFMDRAEDRRSHLIHMEMGSGAHIANTKRRGERMHGGILAAPFPIEAHLRGNFHSKFALRFNGII